MRKLILILLVLVFFNSLFAKENVYRKKNGNYIDYDSLNIEIEKDKHYIFEGSGSSGIDNVLLYIKSENIFNKGIRPKIEFEPGKKGVYELDIRGFLKDKCLVSQKFYLHVKSPQLTPEELIEEPKITEIDSTKIIVEEKHEITEKIITKDDTLKTILEEKIEKEEDELVESSPKVKKKLVDLNTASLDELKTLPITEKQADDIYDFRFYQQFFQSIYDLRKISSIDQKTLNKLKPFVSVSHYDDKDDAAQRREEIYYLIQRLGSNEGLQEGMSDVWEDYLITPRNINKLSFTEIQNMPNVNAQDAAAILRRRAYGDTLANARDLRQTPGVTHYSYTNLRNYVYYKEKPTQNRLFFDYQLKFNTEPYESDAIEMYKEPMRGSTEKTSSYWGFFRMDDISAAVMNKIRIRYQNEWKAGLMYNSNKGEQSFLNADSKEFFNDAKFYLGYEKEFDLAGRNYIKLYGGNFRATYGEGLVMENTDYYSPRKTGYGFNKRIKGIIGDVSRTQQYSLKGLALDWQRKELNAAVFFSIDKKDAIIYDNKGDFLKDENGDYVYDADSLLIPIPDGKIDDQDDAFSYLTMTRRFTDDELASAEDYFNVNTIAPRRDAVEEKLLGAHFEYSPFIGTHLGFTGIEAVYDRDFIVPDGDDLKDLLIDDSYDFNKWKSTDNEISSLYSTYSDSTKYGYDRNYRRVLGLEWQTTLNNTSFQGEYAEMSLTGNEFKIGDDPKALILSAYTLFNDFYILSLYRDYDLEFDNPYMRAFAESWRFDDTIFEKSYLFRNTLLTEMYLNSAQPSAERGVYLETRYRFNTWMTLSRLYLDVWERKSDARKSYRFEGKLDFRPIYQQRFRLRFKQQQKRNEDDLDRGKSLSQEAEITLSSYLSNRDRFMLGYIHGRVVQPPYLSISDPGDASGDDMAQAGNVLTHGDYIFADYTHNLNKNLKIIGSFAVWKGLGISFWDFEDVNLDFNHDDRGYKYWLTIHSRIANNLFFSIKYKYKKQMSRELEFREYNDIPETGQYYYQNVKTSETSIRAQLDWKF
ncbi:MAG TPA: competence protein ComEA [Candidatus Cloacimonetes bacterium]|nr:competence protein ComEA [Candidatus Cloacimonadota bacterium]